MKSFEAAKSVIEVLRRNGAIALLAGGCVRDQLLGRTPKDHDVATDARPEQVCRLFRSAKKVGSQFGVVIVPMKGCDIEVATFRSDGEYQDGRHPESVAFSSAEVDAQRRDFTINGMFYDPLDDRVVDYVGGQKDLALRLIRCIGDPDRRFQDDHLRMLRAVRFAARFGFEIEEATFSAILRRAPMIARISAERVRMELEQILADVNRARGWRLIIDSGLLNNLVESAKWSDGQASRIERILAELPPSAPGAPLLAAILVGFAEDVVHAACRDLRCSNSVTRSVAFLVRSFERLIGRPALELADIKSMLATGLFDELFTLARTVAQVDRIDTAGLDGYCATARDIPADAVSPPPLVRGEDLLLMELVPGPIYREVLDTVYRAQLNETVRSREDALDLVRSIVGRKRS